MRKSFKIIIASLASFLFVATVLLMFLFIPLKGEKHNEVWAYGDAFDISKILTIEKNPDKEFKILQLTDIQLWTNLSDNKKSLEVVENTVDITKPDLIVLTGDNVAGISTNLLIKDLIKVMDSFKIPWAPIFGNHDAEGKATLNWLGDRFLESEYCMFKKGPSNLYGVGNYVINITEEGKVVQSLFMFDNGRYFRYDKETKKEIYMGYDQLAWYKWNVLGIANAEKAVVPSMSFSHFAINEFATAIEKLAVKEKNDTYTVPNEYGFGHCAYLPGVPEVNSGFFELAKELKSTQAMFFGHDHENNASIVYEGIRMTYGLKAGHSPRYWNNAKQYGGTLITLTSSTEYSVEHIVEREV